MALERKASGTKKGRKIGRNRTKCEHYRQRGTRELNKERHAVRIAKGLRSGNR